MPILTKEVKDKLINEIISKISIDIPNFNDMVDRASSKVSSNLRQFATPGKDGVDGRDGRAGTFGQQGPLGRDGLTGPEGRQGERGAQGPAGQTGPKGDNGIQGKQGVSGVKGGKGETGNPGENGKPGENAVITDDIITNLANSIDLSNVMTSVDLDKEIKSLITKIERGFISLPLAGGSRNIYKPYLKVNSSGDDEGLIVENGQFSVGKPGDGRESVFGEGDSYTEGLNVFSTENGATFIDNTDAAKSDSGSTYETFGGFITTGAIDYIGSDNKFCGIKLKTASVITPGTGTVEREFWNGTAWETFTMMATDANSPYTQRADNIGTAVGSEQVRFGGCDSQAKTIINGVEKYWIRFRITSDITAAGEIEQIKLHSSRFEINADGFTEYFGDGIYSKDLAMQWANTIQLDGLSPANEDIVFADNGLKIDYKDNEFANGVTDGRGGIIVIPEGMDTSKGIDFNILWTPLSNLAGDVVYQVVTYQTAVGDILTAANAADVLNSTVTITVGSDNLLTRTSFNIDAQNLVPGEILAFGLKRLGADAADTYGSNVALINIRATGSFWHP